MTRRTNKESMELFQQLYSIGRPKGHKKPYASEQEYSKAFIDKKVDPDRVDLTLEHLFAENKRLVLENLELRTTLVRIDGNRDCSHPEIRKIL